MAVNTAARRFAKAQRRKAVVAEKRKAEILANSTAGQIQRSLAYPIQHCLLSDGLFDCGMGMLVVTRGAAPSDLVMATFLLDTYRLGVKDVFFRATSGSELALYLEWNSPALSMVPVDPCYARKLLRDLVAWSGTLGITPHRDYAKIEAIFGTVKASGSDAQFPFSLGVAPSPAEEMSTGARYLDGHDGGIADDSVDDSSGGLPPDDARLVQHGEAA